MDVKIMLIISGMGFSLGQPGNELFCFRLEDGDSFALLEEHKKVLKKRSLYAIKYTKFLYGIPSRIAVQVVVESEYE